MLEPNSDDQEFEFQIIVTKNFQRRLAKVKDPIIRKKIFQSMLDLARGREHWAGASVKKIEVGAPNRALRSARIDDKLRLIWEGPIPVPRSGKPVLVVHDFLHHDRYERQIRGATRMLPGEAVLGESEFDVDEEPTPVKLDDEVVAFSKPIPPAAFFSPEKLDAVLRSEKANILLTRRQSEILLADRPLLIHGHAGSGKTTVICHRLALSVLDHRARDDTGQIAFLSYNEKLVKQAQKDTKEILRELHFAPDTLEGVDFSSFQDFLRRYAPSKDAFRQSNYVSYGRFRY